MSTFPLNHHNFSAEVREYLKRKAGEAGYKIGKFQVSERENPDFDLEKYTLYKRMGWVISFVRRTYATKEEMFAAILDDYDYDWFKTHIQGKPRRSEQFTKRREAGKKTKHHIPKHSTGEVGSEEARCYWRMKVAERQIRLGKTVKDDYDEFWYKRFKNGKMSRKERTARPDLVGIGREPYQPYEKNDGIGREPYQPLPPPPPALTEEKTLTLHERLLRIGLKPPSELPPPPADFWDN